jgi:aspartate 1-decarboxylase
MFRQFMLGKLHRCTVTRADPDYVGSISIDVELLEAAGIMPYEKVQVVNLRDGVRFETYAIEAPRGSRAIGTNGGAAYLAKPGDVVLIIAYCYAGAGEKVKPRTVIIGEGNEIEAIIDDEVEVPMGVREAVEIG